MNINNDDLDNYTVSNAEETTLEGKKKFSVKVYLINLDEKNFKNCF